MTARIEPRILWSGENYASPEPSGRIPYSTDYINMIVIIYFKIANSKTSNEDKAKYSDLNK